MCLSVSLLELLDDVVEVCMVSCVPEWEISCLGGCLCDCMAVRFCGLVVMLLLVCVSE